AGGRNPPRSQGAWQLDADPSPLARRALDGELTAERLDPVLEPPDTRPAISAGAADPVVGHSDNDPVRVRFDRDLDSRHGRGRMPDDVCEALGNHEVRGRLDSGIEPSVQIDGELDWATRALCQ